MEMNIVYLMRKIAPAVFMAFVWAVCTQACSSGAGADAPGVKSPSDGILMPGKSPGKAEKETGVSGAANVSKSGDAGVSLERITEIERAGAFFPGLALTESGLREMTGDFAGAAIAAYKELAWAYASGSAAKSQVEEGLLNALALFDDASPVAESGRVQASAALRGCLAFVRENWTEAESLLAPLLAADEEPDSFLRWMLYVCALENGNVPGGKAPPGRSAYGAIRARYAYFPGYWYHGARAFSDDDPNIAAAYAEQCVNAGPHGPFAAECRKILAAQAGVTPDGREPEAGAGQGIRTKAEIENIIRASVSVNNPEILEELFPLIALPDNPYTLYALGAMKSLNAVPDFRSFFAGEAHKSSGRLGERLNYISRG